MVRCDAVRRATNKKGAPSVLSSTLTPPHRASDTNSKCFGPEIGVHDLQREHLINPHETATTFFWDENSKWYGFCFFVMKGLNTHTNCTRYSSLS